MSDDRDRRDRVLGIPIWQRDNGRWYADFRQFTYGSRESLGTKNRTEAEQRLAERKEELEEAERQDDPRQAEQWPLEKFCQEHLDRKAREVTEKTWKNAERALGNLCSFLRSRLNRQPHLEDVTARLLSQYADERLDSVKASTVNQELNAISDLLSRALDWRLVDRNEARHVTRPTTERTEPTWLEIGEAVKVLEAAREMETDSSSRCFSDLRPLLATFLLTGGRRMEVFGLRVQDIRPEDEVVQIRPNEHRDLKTRHSKRDVPLWSQLRRIIEPVLERREEGLVFPSRTGRTLTDLRSSLDEVASRAGLEKRLTPKVFRHTYTATRIQTLDGDRPVALFTVARELGHKSVDRIEDVYGHLQSRRQRLPEVRYEESEVVDLEEYRSA